jgi:hypothetical protein
VDLGAIFPEYGRPGTTTTIRDFLYRRNDEGKLAVPVVDELHVIDLHSHGGKAAVSSALKTRQR